MLWHVSGDHGLRLTVERVNQLLAVNIGGDALLAKFVPPHPTDSDSIMVDLVKAYHVNRN